MTENMDSKNIVSIHKSILETFDNDEKTLPIIKQRIDDLSFIYDTCDMSERLKDDIKTEIMDITHRYDIIKSKQQLYFYILEATSLLDEYKREMENPIQVNFLGHKNAIDQTKIRSIHDRFMVLAHKIRPTMFYTRIPNYSNTCSTCMYVHTDDNIITSTNIVTCIKCGTENDVLQFTFSYKDADRINMSSKYTYDRRVHFKESINQFQGKQNSTIKQSIYDALLHQLNLHGLVREGDLPQNIKYEKVTKYHITIFLKEINCSNHYEDLNLIYHVITGKKLDDISHLEDVLMDDFDRLSKIYDEVYIKDKKIMRKNFINTQYVLYQLLRRHKYPCSKNDFNFLKTIERKSFHDDICSTLFKMLGWNFSPVF